MVYIYIKLNTDLTNFAISVVYILFGHMKYT